MEFIKKYFSRKFIVTLIIIGVSAYLPVYYSQLKISDNIIMAVLAIIGGVGATYGVINYKSSAPK